MKLSTFSLTPKKDKEEPVEEVKFESKKITELVNRNAYIEADPNDNSPVFHLKGNYQDSNDEFHLTLNFSKELKYIFVYLLNTKYQFNSHLDGLKDINEQSSISSSLKQYMKNALYIGALYDAFSYCHLPLSFIQENASLLDKFADDSCNHYGHSKEYLSTSITEFFDSLSIVKADIESNRGNEFVILGHAKESKGLPCLGVIGITEQYVYCKLKTTETYKLEYPKEFKFDSSSGLTAIFIASMVYVLLSQLGICKSGDSTYYSTDTNYKSDLPTSSFSDRKILICHELDAVITDADIFKTNKQIKIEEYNCYSSTSLEALKLNCIMKN